MDFTSMPLVIPPMAATLLVSEFLGFFVWGGGGLGLHK